MRNQFSAQLAKLQQILADPNTTTAYSQAVSVTFSLVKEMLMLAWLTVCLVLVVFDWIGTNAIVTGQRSKDLLDNLKEVNSEELAAETGKSIVSAGKAGLAYTIAQAKEQLGLSQESAEKINPITEE
jgi:hypothetical protein